MPNIYSWSSKTRSSTFFCWYLLTCEILPFKSLKARFAGFGSPARRQALTLLVKVNLTTYSFFRDKMVIDMNMLVFFLRKCVQTAAKTVVADRKKNRRH